MDICARLDGLPLAIELAAAQCRVLEPVELRERLVAQADLLTSRQHDVPARHRTLAHAIVIGWFPVVQFFFWKSYRRIGRDLPFFRIKSMSMRERYQAQVFYCFDTLLPRYQWRHKILNRHFLVLALVSGVVAAVVAGLLAAFLSIG